MTSVEGAALTGQSRKDWNDLAIGYHGSLGTAKTIRYSPTALPRQRLTKLVPLSVELNNNNGRCLPSRRLRKSAIFHMTTQSPADILPKLMQTKPLSAGSLLRLSFHRLRLGPFFESQMCILRPSKKLSSCLIQRPAAFLYANKSKMNPDLIFIVLSVPRLSLNSPKKSHFACGQPLEE